MLTVKKRDIRLKNVTKKGGRWKKRKSAKWFGKRKTEDIGQSFGQRPKNNSPSTMRTLPFTMKLLDDHAIWCSTMYIRKCKGFSGHGVKLNLIRLDTLHDEVQVSDVNIYQLQWINYRLVGTMGSVMLTVSNENQSFETEFHRVS